MSKTRLRKVYRKYRERRYDGIEVPEIKLQGHWLAKAGFCSGCRFEVNVQKGKIVLLRKESSSPKQAGTLLKENA